MPVSNRRNVGPPGSAERAPSHETDRTSEHTEVETPSPRPATRLGVAVVVFSVWAATLIGLAVLTANPFALNRAQILAAPIVVEGMVAGDDAVRGGGRHWEVLRCWPNDAVETSIRIEVEGLDDVPLKVGGHFLIPIEPTEGGGYRVVKLPEPMNTAVVYASTPKTLAQLEAILAARR